MTTHRFPATSSQRSAAALSPSRFSAACTIATGAPPELPATRHVRTPNRQLPPSERGPNRSDFAETPHFVHHRTSAPTCPENLRGQSSTLAHAPSPCQLGIFGTHSIFGTHKGRDGIFGK